MSTVAATCPPSRVSAEVEAAKVDGWQANLSFAKSARSMILRKGSRISGSLTGATGITGFWGSLVYNEA